jgi:hypothetical protein
VRAGTRSNAALFERSARDIIRNENLTPDEQSLVSQYYQLTAHELRTEVGPRPAGEAVAITPEIRDTWLWRSLGVDDAAMGRIQTAVADIVAQQPTASQDQILKTLVPAWSGAGNLLLTPLRVVKKQSLSLSDQRALLNFRKITRSAEATGDILESMYADINTRVGNIRRWVGDEAADAVPTPHMDSYLPTVREDVQTNLIDLRRRGATMPGNLGRVFEQASDLQPVIDDLLRAHASLRQTTQPANVGLLLNDYINGTYAKVVWRERVADMVVNSIGVDKRTLARGELERLTKAGYGPITVNPADPGAAVMEGLEDYLVPQVFRERLAAQNAAFWAADVDSFFGKLQRISLETQGYIAPVLLGTRQFMKAQALEQVFNLMGTSGVRADALGEIYKAELLATKVLSLETADHFALAKPRGLLSKWDAWFQGKIKNDGSDLSKVLAKMYPGKSEEEISALSRKYLTEVRDMGITDTGTFGALGEAVRGIYRAEKGRRVVGALEQRGISLEQGRDLAYRMEVGIENMSRVAGYIVGREKGLSPLHARMATFRTFVNYSPEARTVIDRAVQPVAWFVRYTTGRAQQITGLGMNTPGIIKRYPVTPYWTAKMLENRDAALRSQEQQAEIAGGGNILEPGQYPEAWRIISNFSRPPWIENRAEYVPVPWEMLPEDVWPTEAIIGGYMGQEKLGQIAYHRARITPLEMAGDMYRLGTQPVQEALTRLNPWVQFFKDAPERGFEKALEGLPIVGPILRTDEGPSTPAQRIDNDLRGMSEARAAHGEEPMDELSLAGDDPFSIDLRAQRERGKGYFMFPVSFAPIDIKKANLWELDELIELAQEQGGGPIPIEILEGEKARRLFSPSARHE